jgi:hypothetical protein|nr:MAG TPA: protein of unknown function DUF3799 [Caudoviricetes sp.]
MFQNQTNLPLPLAIWLATDEYQYAKYANEISTTTLLKSPRYIIGSRRAMYPEQFPEELRPESTTEIIIPDIQEKIASRMGTAMHSSLEHAWTHNYAEAMRSLGIHQNTIDKIVINPETVNKDQIPVYLEQRAYRELEGFTISGQFDIIVDGELHDLKTTSTYSWTSGCNDEKYIMQGSIYRWLNPELITADTITINFIFTDWRKLDSITNPNYPPAKCFFKQYKLWSLADTEAWLRNKLKTLHKYWNSPLEQIPCCTEKDLFSKASTFKYFKTGYEEGKRATKNFDTMNEALAFRAKNGYQGDVIEFKPEPFMCPYCNPAEVAQLLTTSHTKTLGIV